MAIRESGNKDIYIDGIGERSAGPCVLYPGANLIGPIEIPEGMVVEVRERDPDESKEL